MIRRQLPAVKLELRNKDTRTIGGLAIPYNQPTVLWPGFSEVFLPGSVTVHDQGCFLFWFHEPDQLLASTKTERLRLVFQDDGVHYEADLPDTTLGNDLLALIALGEVSGVSPGFVCDEQNIVYSSEGDTRQIVKARVGEISLTHIPAYPTTSVELRNQGGVFDEERRQVEERKAYLKLLRQRDLKRITSHTRGQ